MLLETKLLISVTIKDRNDLIREGGTSFEQSYIDAFNKKMDGLPAEAKAEADANGSV
ncbi:MAG: hypothetical protein Q4A32_03235 [Lachnospiraceae bacterium]|nr:hypothetical protein [Lachnospiraceae bacterium]